MKRMVLSCEEHTKQNDQLKMESEHKDLQIQVSSTDHNDCI